MRRWVLVSFDDSPVDHLTFDWKLRSVKVDLILVKSPPPLPAAAYAHKSMHGKRMNDKARKRESRIQKQIKENLHYYNLSFLKANKTHSTVD